jgi:hypothetical protein
VGNSTSSQENEIEQEGRNVFEEFKTPYPKKS